MLMYSSIYLETESHIYPELIQSQAHEVGILGHVSVVQILASVSGSCLQRSFNAPHVSSALLPPRLSIREGRSWGQVAQARASLTVTVTANPVSVRTAYTSHFVFSTTTTAKPPEIRKQERSVTVD